METFIGLLSKHLKTFQELESLQASAFQAVNNQMPEGLTGLMERQAEVMSAISREKAELNPFLNQWENLEPDIRQRLREGRAGEILSQLESVAHSIHSKHQKMFGAEDAGPSDQAETNGGQNTGNAGQSGGVKGQASTSQDLSHTINIYRSLQ